jgi:hypothetical protein
MCALGSWVVFKSEMSQVTVLYMCAWVSSQNSVICNVTELLLYLYTARGIWSGFYTEFCSPSAKSPFIARLLAVHTNFSKPCHRTFNSPITVSPCVDLMLGHLANFNFETIYNNFLGPLSLVSTIEELLERQISGSGLENRDYGQRDPLRWPRNTFYPQKLALT